MGATAINLTYNFATRLWTWDFFTWLVIARAHGATGVNFSLKTARSTKFPWGEAMVRFENYLLPGPTQLAGMPVTIDDPSAAWEPDLSDRRQHLPASYERLWLRDPAPKAVRHTVTLRRCWFKPSRNSDPTIWREFARRIGAHVIEDFADQPITLHERFSYYAAARQNYSVPNGPTTVLEYTPYPFCQVADPGDPVLVKGFRGHGVAPGDELNLPPHQRLIWARPTVERLLAIHERCGG